MDKQGEERSCSKSNLAADCLGVIVDVGVAGAILISLEGRLVGGGGRISGIGNLSRQEEDERRWDDDEEAGLRGSILTTNGEEGRSAEVEAEGMEIDKRVGEVGHGTERLVDGV